MNLLLHNHILPDQLCKSHLFAVLYPAVNTPQWHWMCPSGRQRQGTIHYSLLWCTSKVCNCRVLQQGCHITCTSVAHNVPHCSLHVLTRRHFQIYEGEALHQTIVDFAQFIGEEMAVFSFQVLYKINLAVKSMHILLDALSKLSHSRVHACLLKGKAKYKHAQTYNCIDVNAN